MKKINLSLNTLAVLLLWGAFANAQVNFKIAFLPETEDYQVSLLVQETWETPYNLTSTGQITIKVPNGDFEVYDIKNLQNDVEWTDNARFNAPEEAPEFDYISFGLTSLGTKGLKYEAGIEIPLFTFKNSGNCQGEVALLNNESDPFLPPNSRHANIGNQLTVLGAGGNAYLGNADENTANCAVVNAINKVEDLAANFDIYPNPAAATLFLNFDWQQETQDAQLVVYNILGEQVMVETNQFAQGENNLKLNIQNLEEGTYFIKIQGETWETHLPKFTKVVSK